MAAEPPRSRRRTEIIEYAPPSCINYENGNWRRKFFDQLADICFRGWPASLVHPTRIVSTSGTRDWYPSKADVDICRESLAGTEGLSIPVSYSLMTLLCDWYGIHRRGHGNPRIWFTFHGCPLFYYTMRNFNDAFENNTFEAAFQQKLLPEILVFYSYGRSRTTIQDYHTQKPHAVLWVIHFKKKEIWLINSWPNWTRTGRNQYSGGLWEFSQARVFLDPMGAAWPVLSTSIPCPMIGFAAYGPRPDPRALTDISYWQQNITDMMPITEHCTEIMADALKKGDFTYHYLTTGYQGLYSPPKDSDSPTVFPVDCGCLAVWTAFCIAMMPKNLNKHTIFPPLPFNDRIQFRRYCFMVVHNGKFPQGIMPPAIVKSLFDLQIPDELSPSIPTYYRKYKDEKGREVIQLDPEYEYFIRGKRVTKE